jgi:hypothetical protein
MSGAGVMRGLCSWGALPGGARRRGSESLLLGLGTKPAHAAGPQDIMRGARTAGMGQMPEAATSKMCSNTGHTIHFIQRQDGRVERCALPPGLAAGAGGSAQRTAQNEGSAKGLKTFGFFDSGRREQQCQDPCTPTV